MSRLGRKPIAVPQGVSVSVVDGAAVVEGAKGKLVFPLAPQITIDIKDSVLIVKRVGEAKQDKAFHGLTRALLANMIEGVNVGYTRELEIQGVGFKAQAQGDKLTMSLGFSHQVNFSIPEGIKIETPKATQIVIRGIDKQKVGDTAAKIRSIFPPEPYKGKGIRYAGEYIKKKVGKAQASTK